MQRGTPKVKCSQLLLPELFWHISKVVNGPFFYGSVIFWGKPSLSFLCLFRSLFWKHGVPLSFQLSMFCSSFSRLVTSCENDDICVDGWEKSITTNLSFQFPPLKGDSWETPLLINVNGVNWCKNCLCQKGFWSGEMQKRSPISRSLTRANLKSDPMHIWESTNWICQAVLQPAKEEKNGGRADL